MISDIRYESISESGSDCPPSKLADRCTPARAVVEAKAWGRYHVLLPAKLAVGIPNPGNLPLVIGNAQGNVCWDTSLGPDPFTGRPAGCNGTEGAENVQRAGAGFLMPDKKPGALVSWTNLGTTFFAINGRAGNLSKDSNGLSMFHEHEGYFEFDVEAAAPESWVPHWAIATFRPIRTCRQP